MSRRSHFRAAKALVATCLVMGAADARAHEMRPGFLELRERDPGRYAVLWKKPAGGETEIEISPVFPDGCELRAEGRGQTTPGAIVTRGDLRCDGGVSGKTFAMVGLEASFTDVLVRIQHADGRIESHLVKPVEPSITLGADTTAWSRAGDYLRLGCEHILLGVDHLLFVLGLMLLVGDRWMLVKTITAFTLAHSLTLGAVTLGYASAPLLPLNAAIALSILFLGPEILRKHRGETSVTIRHSWAIAFAFGLLHGFGFASGLSAMGLPPPEIPLALLLFNVGVEVGQLAFVFLVLALERSFDALAIVWPNAVKLLPAYTIGSLGAYWTIQRTLMLIGGPL